MSRPYDRDLQDDGMGVTRQDGRKAFVNTGRLLDRNNVQFARYPTRVGFDAESVFGRMVGRFHEQLADCRSFEERISVANQLLTQRAYATRAWDGVSAAAHQMLSEAGAGCISAMAERAGLSVRQFRRIFLQKVGVSPKLFARIVRFEAALDRMARSSRGSWTEVAHRFGYYDQMHMIHEFAQFTGETLTRTLYYFEATFQRQITAMQSGSAPRSDGGRWIL